MATRQHSAKWSPLKYDPDFCGPQKHRSCTDILCLLLFIVFLGAWAAVALYAFKNGDPQRLLRPTDSFGYRCGEEKLANKTNLFFFDLTTCLTPEALLEGCQTPQVCRTTCPKDVWVADIYTTGGLPFNKTDVQNNLICVDSSIAQNVNTSSQLKEMIDQKACAGWYVPSVAFYFRCVPDLKMNITKVQDEYKQRYNFSSLPFDFKMLNESKQVMQGLNDVNEVTKSVLKDLDATWRYLILFCLAALVVSLVYIILLRFLAGIVIWLSILALIALLATGSYFSFKNYEFLRDHPTGRIVPDSNSLGGKVTKLFNHEGFWLFLLIVCAILLLVIVLIVVFLRSRIYIATTLIKEGSKAVSSTISTLFFPLIPWALHFGVFLWALAIFLFLYSTGTDVRRIEGMGDGTCTCENAYKGIANNASCTVEEFNIYCHQTDLPTSHCFTAGCSIYTFDSSSIVIYLQLFNLFGFFWGYWFVSGLAQMILAGVFATWYWTFDKKNVPFFALTRSIFRTIGYHLGTIAFGSLIIAICSFIRVMLELIQRKIKKYDNAFTKAVFCCCKCFFYCLEKFLCFINRNAYIMCAIYGKNFCLSAKDAFQLLMRNVIRVVFVDKVTDFLFFLGKFLVTAGLVFASYPVFTKPIRLLDDTGLDVTLTYPWLPMVIIGVMTYIITSLFFSVYSVAVDTLFLCFLEDSERNDGSGAKPFYMSKELMKILGKKNKKDS